MPENTGDLQRRLQRAEAIVEALQNEEVDAIIGKRNVALLRQMERELRRSESLYRELVQNASTAIIRWKTDGTITFFNEYAQALFGYSEEEILGKHASVLLPHSDSTEGELASLVEDIANCPERYLRNINENVCRDGTRLWIAWTNKPILDAKGEVREILSVGMDVTDRKKAEDALRRSEERLRLAVEVAELGTWVYDLDREELSFSDRGREMYGLPPQGDVTVERVLEAIHPADRDFVRGFASETLSDRRAHEAEYRILMPCGSVRWVSVRSITAPDAQRGRTVNVGIVNDVTERKEYEQFLETFNEELERRVADRTAEARTLTGQLRALAIELSQAEQRERKRLADVLHDHIQQNLAAALMQIEMMQAGGNPERVEATARRTSEILAETIEASRSLSVELSPPALSQGGLAGGLKWLVGSMREKHGFTVNLSVDPEAACVAEETRLLLFESVREILFNAVKHSGIHWADVAVRRVEDRVCVSVRDEGKGFDAALLGEGGDEVSFGLFSIQQRISHIGGEVEVDSSPGRGTKVTLTVLRDEEVVKGEEASADAQQEAKVASHSGRKAIRVLVVDDHSIMREGLTGLLESEPDIEVVGEADSGPRAIELADALRPDIVIMDVGIGEMTGIEATREILARNPRTKVVGLSMFSEQEVADVMREAGASAYLTKGGPSEDLFKAVRECRLE